MITVTATQMKNRFGRYLYLARRNGEVLIRKHGKIVAKLVSAEEESEKKFNHSTMEVESEWQLTEHLY